jgi:hypothetical protein
MSWLSWLRGAPGDQPDNRKNRDKSKARPRPLVWCEVGKHWVRGYKPGGPPISHKPCSDDDDSVITRQIKPIPPEE